MIVEILWGSLITCVLFVLPLYAIIGGENRSPLWSRIRQRRNLTGGKRLPPPTEVLTKNMIIAMAQREIYKLNDNVACPKAGVDMEQKYEDEQWARQIITRSCVRLDRNQPNVVYLSEAVNNFCDQIEKMIDEYKKNLSEINAMLIFINREQRLIEQQFSTTKSCMLEEMVNDECFMLVFDQIVNNSV